MAERPVNKERAAERRHWRTFPRTRPASPPRPAAGQESVWDYPRPPRLEAARLPVAVHFAGVELARSRRALRVCETASPPCYYIPPGAVRTAQLLPSAHESFCEWKGTARYWHVRVGDSIARDAAWSYPDPDSGYEALRDCLAFYPGRVQCTLGAERVRPQPGNFYGGWVTRAILGPFKGEPGSESW